MMNFKDKLTDKEIEYEWNWKIEKEIEDLKLIIESKNNQVESKISILNAWENYFKYEKEQSNRAWFRTTLLFYQFFNKKIDRYIIESVPKS